MSLLIDEAHNVLTPSVAKMLAEGRSAGLEAVFAWQYSAQIRDEVIRSGVRSLLQSISIFRMREMEDARSLAGLAMEVYSDRISIDQDEQERLRFSPDDILRLPVHHAINLWIAGGVPRAGFVAHTLPMEELHDEALAEHHLDAQRARGGHHPDAPRTTRSRSTTRHMRSRETTAAIRAIRRPRRREHDSTRLVAHEIHGATVRRPPARWRSARCRTSSMTSAPLPPSYVEAHRYDGAVIEHDDRDRTRALRDHAARRRDRPTTWRGTSS